jgi:peptidoglycan/LPS O-acetylase OafA/YrhL
LLVTLRQRLTRVTSSVAYIPQIDGLRALAVLLVIGHHIFATYLVDSHRLGVQKLPRDWNLIYSSSSLVAWGIHLTFGVQLFFVISGFVLAIPFARGLLDKGQAPSTKLYLLRRLVRIEPPYLINMTFCFLLIVVPWRGLLPWSQSSPYIQSFVSAFGPHYLASIVYLHGIIFGEPSWINGIAWTLEIEIQFYLLMPLIAQLFRIHKAVVRRSILILLILLAAWVAPCGAHNPRLSLTIVCHIGFFLAGILLADIYLHPPRGFSMGPLKADLFALASGALLIYVVHWRPLQAWAEPFLIAAFFFSTFHGHWMGRIFSFPALTLTGTICYSTYLYHFFVIELLMPVTVRHLSSSHALWFDTGLRMLLILPPVLVVSAVLYLFTERPFIVLSHTLTRRWRTSAITTTGEAS